LVKRLAITQLPENIVPITGKFVPGPLRILAAATDGTTEQIAAGMGCTKLKTGVPVGLGGADVLVAVGVTVAVAVGVAVDCFKVAVAVGKGVAVGSTVVRLQASGNKKARPRMILCHQGSRDMVEVMLLANRTL
jgi:hypothetical protein